ncbi:MAG TPA: dihydrofolate reductase family protein [Candidatus Gracilibacteria bacterium]
MKVILLMAITLDGKIAKDSDHFPDWTGKEDKKLFVKLTKEAGVLIMGSRTYDTIGKPLPERLNIVMTRDKKRINESNVPLKVETDRESDRGGLIFTDSTPQEILTRLEAKGFTKVVLAGGTQINSLFLQERLIDELHVTISPLIFGKGLGLFADDLSCDLQLQSCERLGEDLIYAIYNIIK